MRKDQLHSSHSCFSHVCESSELSTEHNISWTRHERHICCVAGAIKNVRLRGVEPRFPRPQRDVLTTRRQPLLHVLDNGDDELDALYKR